MSLMINGVFIKDHERVDDLQRDGLRIIQDPALFCFGMDSVLLTGFVNVKKSEAVLDLGTGTGVIPILLTAKFRDARYEGLEIRPESVDMAQRSVMLNGLGHMVTVTQGDIKHCDLLYKPSSFDVVTSNPPYMKRGSGLLNDSDPKASARHELLCNLDDVVMSASRLLKPQGRFYMVHRPHRLTDIICALRANKLEPKRLRFVVSRSGEKPCMLLTEAVRGGKPETTVLPELVIYKPDGTYTEEVLTIYNN